MKFDEKLDEKFRGKLVSDFYSAYSWYKGEHQRCLVHLDRDLDELKVKYSAEASVCAWVDKVLDLIGRAKRYDQGHREKPTHDRLQRRKWRQAIERELGDLARDRIAGAACPSRCWRRDSESMVTSYSCL